MKVCRLLTPHPYMLAEYFLLKPYFFCYNSFLISGKAFHCKSEHSCGFCYHLDTRASRELRMLGC